MIHLQTLCCKTFLESAQIGSDIPHGFPPGALPAWIRAWAACMRCPVDSVTVAFLQDCIEHGSSSLINKDWFFRQQVRFVATSMGMHYTLIYAYSNITDDMEVKICITSDWRWRVPDFACLAQAQSKRVIAKRNKTATYLADLAFLHKRFATIEAEFKERPSLFSCMPWSWHGCCGQCAMVKQMVEELPKSMYQKCFQQLVSNRLVRGDFGIGIYIADRD